MVVFIVTLVVVAVAGVLILGVVRRARRWGETTWPELDASRWWDDDDDEPDDGPGGVREPRRPLPSGGAAAASVEPDTRAA